MNSKFTIVTNDYPIYIEKNYENLINMISNNYSSNIRIGIITDSNVGRFYLNEIVSKLKKIYNIHFFIIKAGEESKSIETYYKIHKFLLDNSFTRSDILISLGGGVVGDLTGFVASTYMRGINYIQVPTTLLSQVDSSIGGKTAINIDRYKNIIGCFYNPTAVYININTLYTLENHHLISGYAEILKMAIINSFNLFQKFSKYNIFDLNDIDELIYESILVKKYYIENDFFDKNLRMMLNFGHTFGHALESLFLNRITHGECVAYGMLIALKISFNRGYINIENYINITKQIERLVDIKFFTDIDIDKVIKLMYVDKKKDNNKQRWILIKDLYKPIIVNDVEDEEIKNAYRKIIQVSI